MTTQPADADGHGPRHATERSRWPLAWLKRSPGLKQAPPSQFQNDFYLKVSIVALVILGIALAQAWILQYYFNDSLISIISFRGFDPSWVPKGTSFGPALGDHYFGDFEQYMGYATSHTPPYSSAIQFPAGYGPISIVMVKVFNFLFGWPGAVLVFLPVTLLFFLWGMCRLMGGFLSARLLGILMVFTGGIIICLDRGNLQILVATLCVWFCVGVVEDRPLLTILPLAVGMSMKLYVAVLLLVLIRQRRWRDTGSVIAVSLAIYLVCFAFVGGGYLSDIRNFVHTNVLFASSPTLGFVVGCVSAASVVYKIILLSMGTNNFLHFLQHSPTSYIQIPGLVIAALCAAVIWLTKRPVEYMLVAALALMQLGPASTYPYVEINTVIELALLMRIASRPPIPDTHSVPDTDPVISRWVLVVCIGFLLIGSAPWFGDIYGTDGSNTSVNWLFSAVASIAVVLTLFGALLFGVRARSRQRKRESRASAEVREAEDPVPLMAQAEVLQTAGPAVSEPEPEPEPAP
jgi:hypothetical protein